MAAKIPKFKIGDRVRAEGDVRCTVKDEEGVVCSEARNWSPSDPHFVYYKVKIGRRKHSIYARNLTLVAPLSPVEAAATKWARSFIRKCAQ